MAEEEMSDSDAVRLAPLYCIYCAYGDAVPSDVTRHVTRKVLASGPYSAIETESLAKKVLTTYLEKRIKEDSIRAYHDPDEEFKPIDAFSMFGIWGSIVETGSYTYRDCRYFVQRSYTECIRRNSKGKIRILHDDPE